MALGEVSREEFRQSVYRLAQLRQQLVDELARWEKAKDEHKNTIRRVGISCQLMSGNIGENSPMRPLQRCRV
jgi:hypothetical protein